MATLWKQEDKPILEEMVVIVEEGNKSKQEQSDPKDQKNQVELSVVMDIALCKEVERVLIAIAGTSEGQLLVQTLNRLGTELEMSQRNCIPLHQGPIMALTVSQTYKQVVTTGQDGILKMFSLERKTTISKINVTN